MPGSRGQLLPAKTGANLSPSDASSSRQGFEAGVAALDTEPHKTEWLGRGDPGCIPLGDTTNRMNGQLIGFNNVK
jgi:hypothetical protein